jgi:opacity protein-like surface antigen
MKKACVGLLAAVLAVSLAADAAFAQCSRNSSSRSCRERERSHRVSHRSWSHNNFPISLEARLDAGIPVGDNPDDLDTGLGWGVGAALDLAPAFAISGEYSQFNFEFQDSDIERDTDGFGVGGRLHVGTGGGVWNPFLQFGALFHDDDTGFEAGVGGDYPVSGNLGVTPMIRFRKVDELQYLTLGFGLNFRL